MAEQIYAKLEQWLQQRGRHLPKIPTGLAIRPAFNQSAGLKVYLEDGRGEVDSNLVGTRSDPVRWERLQHALDVGTRAMIN